MEDLRKLSIKVEVETNEAKKDIKNINVELDETAKKAKEAETQAKSLGVKLKDTFKSASANLISENFVKFGKSMQSAGAKLTLVTAPLTMGLKNSIKGAMNLDTAIRKVNTLNDKNILPTDQLRKNIRAISDESGIAQEEISEGFYQALSSGVDSSRVTDFVKSGVKLTKAGFTDMATVIDATTTVLNAYGDKAYDVLKIHDILVQTQNKGKITVDELGKSIGRVIPTASVAGVNLNQLGAAYSVLTNSGQDANHATTNLNSMLQEMATTGSKADKALRASTGKSFKEIMSDGKDLEFALDKLQEQAKASGLELADMFGAVTSRNAVNKLFGSNYREILNIMNNSQGSVNNAFDEMMGDEEKWQRTMTKFRNVFIDISDNLLPVVQGAAETLNKVLDDFNNFTPEKKARIAKILGLTAIAGPGIAIAGTTVKAIGGVAQGTKWIAGLFTAKKGLDAVSVAGTAIATANTAANVAGVATAAEGLAGSAAGASAAVGGLSLGIIGLLGALTVGAAIGIPALINTSAVKRKEQAAEEAKRKQEFHQKLTITPEPYRPYGVPSHKTGLERVPHDNYLANLHEGERVLTKEEAYTYNQMSNSNETAIKYVNPTINFTINAQESQNEIDIARECEKKIEDFFRNLRLQRI